MSLLIKALDKAENDKSESDKVEHSNTKQPPEKNKAKGLAGEALELSLSPTNNTLAQLGATGKSSTSAAEQTSSASAPSLVPFTSQASSAPSKSAANMFSAKRLEASNQNTRLALIAGAGLLALLAMGIYFVQFIDNTPELVNQPRLIEQLAPTQPSEISASATLAAVTAVLPAEAARPQTFELDKPAQPTAQQEAPELPVKKMPKQQAMNVNEELAVDDKKLVDETLVAATTNKKDRKSTALQFGESIASPSAFINVSKTKSEVAGVNPVLMSAYEAYNAGDDASAQKLYKQVLQRDVRNVDALLGLGAIASRQGRVADANDWFGKVLEVDPRNSVAQAALLDNQPQGNEANNESRIKNMLAKHPDDANLHVALGNLYAEQNQWPAAQQAYFDAYSLNGSADNAFNLAVSLDQMGKPKLALPYYQRALEQASSTSSIDKAALEARIAAIQ